MPVVCSVLLGLTLRRCVRPVMMNSRLFTLLVRRVWLFALWVVISLVALLVSPLSIRLAVG